MTKEKKAKGGRKVGNRREPSESGRRPGGKAAVIKMAAFFLLAAVILAMAAVAFLSRPSEGRISRGVGVGPVRLSGMTVDQATTEIERFLVDYRLNFSTADGQVALGPFVGASNAIAFDPAQAAQMAYDVGRTGGAIRSTYQRIRSALLRTELRIPVSVDDAALTEQVTSLLGEEVRPAEDARIRIAVSEDGDYEISLSPESAGRNFDVSATVYEVRDRLTSLSSDPIELRVTVEQPRFSVSDLEPLVPDARTAMERAPRTVRARSITWTVSRSHVADWLAPERDGRDIRLTLDRDRVAKSLETYSSSMAVRPIDAVFEMQDGRVTKFSPGIDGEKLDLDASYGILVRELIGDGEPTQGTIDLPVAVAEPEITTEKSNPYGIKEIVGAGASNFRGSPANRRHNIALGASSLNGLIVAPGEEFSLIGALGEIDGEHGYLPELVIKDNRTTPEFGGGLCQIGTTTFRTVLNAGLPVTARRNHSYRVSYYERDGDGNYMGPGKDATIYDPAPDFKFLNDTGHHILIMTKITGDRIDFTFWGVRDGRQAGQTDAVILSQTSPPPKKVILTTELPVGKEKCTETAHAGANVIFTYTVTYPNGEVKKEDFTSWYKPWQEVCLLGATPEDITAEQEQAIPDATTEPAPTDSAAPAPSPSPTPEG
ncbi:MAG: VanW family protein [bacterium]